MTSKSSQNLASREELKEAFKLFDVDGDGEITLKEFENLLVKLQTDPAHNFQGGKDDITSKMRAEIKALLKFADKDKSGTITFNEFQELWEGLKGMGDEEEDESEIREEFNRMDSDGSGYISKEEILKMITSNHRLRNSEEEAKKCLDEIDVDGNGMISYPEFLMVWKFKA